MLSEEYSNAARNLLRAARTMTDRHIARQLEALAEDYERRAEKGARADAAETLDALLRRPHVPDGAEVPPNKVK